MSTAAQWTVVWQNEHEVVIRDVGPWDRYPTVTNDAERVVRQLAERGLLGGRRLLCFDSEGRLDEIVYDDNEKFVGFKTAELTTTKEDT